MKKFKYVQAQSVEDAYLRLASNYHDTKLLAGGLDLIGELKEHITEPETVISISRLEELKGIQDNGGSIRIGAITTLSELVHNETIQSQYTALAEAAASVGSPQIRHAGTIGGNLCQRPRCWYYRDEHYDCLKKGGSICYSIAGRNKYHAILGGGPCFMVHPSDCAPALIALSAKIYLEGADGPREMPLEEFFVLPRNEITRETVIHFQEILTRIEMPVSNMKSTYIKFRERDGFDWALSSAAVAMELDGLICTKASIVLGGVAPAPWRATSAQEFLQGKDLTEDVARQAGELAVEGATPLSDNAEKVDITKAIVKKAILRLKPGAMAVEDSLLY